VNHLLARDGSVQVLGVGRSKRLDGHYTHTLRWLGADVLAPLPPALFSDGVDPRYEYRRLDLRSPEDVASALDEFRPDVIIHAAAALRDEPWSALAASNIDAAMALVLGNATSANPARIVTISSGSVYGATSHDALPLRESSACYPLDLYAASKKAAEDVARILAGQHDVWLANARVFNLLGPGLQDRHLTGSLAAQLSAISLGMAEPRIRVGPLGSTRDFVDVRDAASAVVTVAEKGAAGTSYNVASGTETSTQLIFDLLVAASQLVGSIELERQPGRHGDLDRSYADISGLLNLGHAPVVALEQSLTDMLSYYRDTIASLHPQ
jgi:nucleoside-diphosphate-sugar epimerase